MNITSNFNFRLSFLIICLAVFFLTAPPAQFYAAVAVRADRHENPIHGGELQAIGNCNIGHVEIIVDEGTVEIWILSGGRGILKPVGIPDKNIGMKIYAEGSKIPRNLVLNPLPIDGDAKNADNCSHFIGYTEVLKEPGTRFKAVGDILYNGAKLKLVIEYPLEDGKSY